MEAEKTHDSESEAPKWPVFDEKAALYSCIFKKKMDSTTAHCMSAWSVSGTTIHGPKHLLT